jgi:hypothetical protein
MLLGRRSQPRGGFPAWLLPGLAQHYRFNGNALEEVSGVIATSENMAYVESPLGGQMAYFNNNTSGSPASQVICPFVNLFTQNWTVSILSKSDWLGTENLYSIFQCSRQRQWRGTSIWLMHYCTGRHEYYITPKWNTVNYAHDFVSGYNYAKDAWIHHVLTYNHTSRVCRYYLNGVLLSDVIQGAAFDTGSTISTMVRLGVHWGDTDSGPDITRSFKGWMADARIYTGRVFADAEVAALWAIYAAKI